MNAPPESALSIGAIASDRERGFPISPVELVSFVLIVVGGVVLSLANGTFYAGVLAIVFLPIGCLVNGAVSGWRRAEQRAFIQTYAACVLIAGLVQYYERSVGGEAIGRTDAVTFYDLIAGEPPYPTWTVLRQLVNAPLAPWIWQNVYVFCGSVGFDRGPYIGVLFNSLMVGLTGAVTVATARILFGNDRWRLHRVGAFFAWCGMFWLFGAILLRDCFCLFANALVLWSLAKFLKRQRLKDGIVVAIVVTLASYSMLFLREGTIVLYAVFVSLALGCWLWSARIGLGQVLACALFALACLLGFDVIERNLQSSLMVASREKEWYVGWGELTSGEGSIGVALLMQGMLPVRLILGSAAMLIYPLPLWAYLESGAREYHLIKSWQGVYMVLMMPLILAGYSRILGQVFRRKEGEPRVALFIASYAAVALLAVAATSLETRHIGQFLPAALIVAAIPDTREGRTRRSVKGTAILWLLVVTAVHVVWMSL